MASQVLGETEPDFTRLVNLGETLFDETSLIESTLASVASEKFVRGHKYRRPWAFVGLGGGIIGGRCL